jgi:hypothetical protein
MKNSHAMEQNYHIKSDSYPLNYVVLLILHMHIRTIEMTPW